MIWRVEYSERGLIDHFSSAFFLRTCCRRRFDFDYGRAGHPVTAKKFERTEQCDSVSMLLLLDFRSLERADGFAGVPDLKVQVETRPAHRSLAREFISSCWALSLVRAPLGKP
jgi:hypothetical protein